MLRQNLIREFDTHGTSWQIFVCIILDSSIESVQFKDFAIRIYKLLEGFYFNALRDILNNAGSKDSVNRNECFKLMFRKQYYELICSFHASQFSEDLSSSNFSYF